MSRPRKWNPVSSPMSLPEDRGTTGEASSPAIEKELGRQMRSLSRRARTEEEVRQRLAKKELDQKSIEAIITSLKRYSFLDDQRYAEEVVRSKTEMGFGLHRIRAMLKERGCPESLAEAALNEYTDPQQQQRLLESVIEKRIRTRGEPEDPKALKSLLSFCSRRGFDHELVRCVLKPWFDRILGE